MSMILESAVEGHNLHKGAGSVTIAKSQQGTQSQAKQDKKDESLLTLQELLLLLAQEHDIALQTLATPHSSSKEGKKKTAKSKSVSATSSKKEEAEEEKTLTKIADDFEEISSEEEITGGLDEDLVFSKYDSAGAELFAKNQYQQQLAQYAKFLNAYLKGGKYREFKPDLRGYNNGGEVEEKREVGAVSMLSFDEKTNHVRATVMNSMLGTGANHVDSNIGDSYDLWRLFQHNQVISFLYTAQFRSH